MEKLTLAVPQQLGPTVTEWTVGEIRLIWTRSAIYITLFSPAGDKLTCTYEGEVAATMLKNLNTANLSTKSLHRRVLERLAADDKIANGTIFGAPDA